MREIVRRWEGPQLNRSRILFTENEDRPTALTRQLYVKILLGPSHISLCLDNSLPACQGLAGVRIQPYIGPWRIPKDPSVPTAGPLQPVHGTLKASP